MPLERHAPSRQSLVQTLSPRNPALDHCRVFLLPQAMRWRRTMSSWLSSSMMPRLPLPLSRPAPTAGEVLLRAMGCHVKLQAILHKGTSRLHACQPRAQPPAQLASPCPARAARTGGHCQAAPPPLPWPPSASCSSGGRSGSSRWGVAASPGTAWRIACSAPACAGATMSSPAPLLLRRCFEYLLNPRSGVQTSPPLAVPGHPWRQRPARRRPAGLAGGRRRRRAAAVQPRSGRLCRGGRRV